MGYLRSKENVYWCIQVDKNGQIMDNERIIGGDKVGGYLGGILLESL